MMKIVKLTQMYRMYFGSKSLSAGAVGRMIEETEVQRLKNRGFDLIFIQFADKHEGECLALSFELTSDEVEHYHKLCIDHDILPVANGGIMEIPFQLFNAISRSFSAGKGTERI